MLKTYNLVKPEEESVSDFAYVYPDTLDIDKNIFVHLGFGLYMISQERNKLTPERAAEYHRLSFVGFHNEIMSDKDSNTVDEKQEFYSEPETEEEILFVYSKRYSCWGESALKQCLLEQASLFQVPEELASKWNYVIDKMRKAEARNKWRESLRPCGDVWHCSEKMEELDIPFDFSNERKQGKYVMLDGKVGTRVADGVFKFKPPFHCKREGSDYCDEKYTGYTLNYLPSISAFGNGINADCVVLYKEMWSGGSISVLDNIEVYYVAFDEKNEYLKRVADFYDLKMQVYHKTDQTVSDKPAYLDIIEATKTIVEEWNNRPKMEVEAEFRQAGYKEVFQNRGYHGNWEISYLKLFEFHHFPQTIGATYVAFTEEGIAYCGECSSMDEVKVLPYDMLKYLRIDCITDDRADMERKGHTFIAMNDEKEEALVGEDRVRLWKELR